MKKIFLLAFAACIFLTAGAQIANAVLTDAAVIRDTEGQLIHPKIWRALLSSGDYKLARKDTAAAAPEYIILRYTEEEKKKLASRPFTKPTESKYFKTGTSIASFSDRDMEGNHYKLKNMKGKIVVLNFWFVNCGPCRMEIPELNKLTEKYAANPDVVFIAIALDPREQVEEFLNQRPFKYHIIENGRYITSQYGVASYPTHVVVDKEGIVRFHTSGYGRSTVPYIDKSIEELLQATPGQQK
jgi:thiol-disulfide isomerase/thioredoxin